MHLKCEIRSSHFQQKEVLVETFSIIIKTSRIFVITSIGDGGGGDRPPSWRDIYTPTWLRCLNEIIQIKYCLVKKNSYITQKQGKLTLITNHMSTDRQEFLLLFQSVSVFCCCSWFPLRLHRQLHDDLLQVIITTAAATNVLILYIFQNHLIFSHTSQSTIHSTHSLPPHTGQLLQWWFSPRGGTRNMHKYAQKQW